VTGWNLPPGCTNTDIERAQCDHAFGPDGRCDDCGEYDVGHVDPNYDPTPWCAGCGAMHKRDCHCGPLDPMD
jgi:hypothetical protein